MSPRDPLPVGRLASAVDLAGSLVLVGYVLIAAVRLIRGHGVPAARLAVADGVVLALSIKTAGTLLKILQLRDWQSIATFAAILALRTLLKRTFAWERDRLRAAGVPPESGPTSPPSNE